MRKGPYWHIFPTYNEAKNAVWLDPNMLFRVIPEELIVKKNESELRVHLVGGSYIQLIGADNPDRLRGAGPLGFVLDEYDTMKADVWPTLQPIVRANGGWAWFVGTPKGKQKLYDLHNLAMAGDDEWGAWHLKASTSGIIAKDQLENSRKTMSQSMFNQEFECAFLEGEGSVFRRVKEIATAVPVKPQLGHKYVAGIDLAKVQDYTVIVIYDRTTREQVYQDRFNKLEWPFQKKRIAGIAKYYNDAHVVLDATGLGDTIADDLSRAGVRIQPFKLTNISKKEIIEKLSIWIEMQRIRIIPMEQTFLEFDNFSYTLSPQGKVYYNARDGYHDDIVIAHALAIQGLHYVKERTGVSSLTTTQVAKARALARRNEGSYNENYII